MNENPYDDYDPAQDLQEAIEINEDYELNKLDQEIEKQQFSDFKFKVDNDE